MGTDFGSWLLDTNHYDSSTTKIETSPGGNDFESWFLINGGYLHPAVEIATGHHGIFFRVKKDHVLLPGTKVVSCPHELTISWPGVNHYHFPHVNSTFTSRIATRLFLMKQRLLKEQSPWWPYINNLPRSFSTPLWYDDNDLIWLRGTNLGNAKEVREDAWRQEYEHAMQSLFANRLDFEQKYLWTWELYLWAASVMTTRSFAGPVSYNRKEDYFAVAGDGVDRCPVLIPGLDLLNHKPSAKVSWVWDVNFCALRVDESIPSGCQVWNNYDSKSNEELIMGYGFSLPENTSDHYSVGFSPAIAAYIKATNARRLARKPSSNAVRSQSTRESDNIQPKLVRWTLKSGAQVVESSEDFNVEEILEQNIHWVRLLENGSFQFSPQFLEYFSIAVENPREAHMADDCSAYKTLLSDCNFSRNKLHVICAVIMILQRGQRAIRKHDKELPEGPQNSKQVDAARYRDSQLNILDSVLDSLCKFLKSVTSANSPEARGFGVVTLKHILTDLPKSLLKDLRGVLNAGLRTRDPIKIQERGGVDFAFTVWLCGLWIYSLSDPQGEDELNPKYSRWLHFLQQKYTEPSEDSINQHRLETPVFQERPKWFDPVRSASGLDERDSPFIARSFFDAVQAATKKRSQSMYNDSQITVGRLEWCLNIIKNEGVWCPDLNQGEEAEDDEWIIFIELEDC